MPLKISTEEQDYTNTFPTTARGDLLSLFDKAVDKVFTGNEQANTTNAGVNKASTEDEMKPARRSQIVDKSVTVNEATPLSALEAQLSANDRNELYALLDITFNKITKEPTVNDLAQNSELSTPDSSLGLNPSHMSKSSLSDPSALFLEMNVMGPFKEPTYSHQSLSRNEQTSSNTNHNVLENIGLRLQRNNGLKIADKTGLSIDNGTTKAENYGLNTRNTYNMKTHAKHYLKTNNESRFTEPAKSDLKLELTNRLHSAHTNNLDTKAITKLKTQGKTEAKANETSNYITTKMKPEQLNNHRTDMIQFIRKHARNRILSGQLQQVNKMTGIIQNEPKEPLNGVFAPKYDFLSRDKQQLKSPNDQQRHLERSTKSNKPHMHIEMKEKPNNISTSYEYTVPSEPAMQVMDVKFDSYLKLDHSKRNAEIRYNNNKMTNILDAGKTDMSSGELKRHPIYPKQGAQQAPSMSNSKQSVSYRQTKTKTSPNNAVIQNKNSHKQFKLNMTESPQVKSNLNTLKKKFNEITSGWGTPLSTSDVLAKADTISKLLKAQELVNFAHDQVLPDHSHLPNHADSAAGHRSTLDHGHGVSDHGHTDTANKLVPFLDHLQSHNRALQTDAHMHIRDHAGHRNVDALPSGTNSVSKEIPYNIAENQAFKHIPEDKPSQLNPRKDSVFRGQSMTHMNDKISDTTSGHSIRHMNDKVSDTTSGHSMKHMNDKISHTTSGNVDQSPSSTGHVHRDGPGQIHTSEQSKAHAHAAQVATHNQNSVHMLQQTTDDHRPTFQMLGIVNGMTPDQPNQEHIDKAHTQNITTHHRHSNMQGHLAHGNQAHGETSSDILRPILRVELDANNPLRLSRHHNPDIQHHSDNINVGQKHASVTNDISSKLQNQLPAVPQHVRGDSHQQNNNFPANKNIQRNTDDGKDGKLHLQNRTLGAGGIHSQKQVLTKNDHDYHADSKTTNNILKDNSGLDLSKSIGIVENVSEGGSTNEHALSESLPKYQHELEGNSVLNSDNMNRNLNLHGIRHTLKKTDHLNINATMQEKSMHHDLGITANKLHEHPEQHVSQGHTRKHGTNLQHTSEILRDTHITKAHSDTGVLKHKHGVAVQHDTGLLADGHGTKLRLNNRVNDIKRKPGTLQSLEPPPLINSQQSQHNQHPNLHQHKPQASGVKSSIQDIDRITPSGSHPQSENVKSGFDQMHSVPSDPASSHDQHVHTGQQHDISKPDQGHSTFPDTPHRVHEQHSVVQSMSDTPKHEHLPVQNTNHEMHVPVHHSGHLAESALVKHEHSHLPKNHEIHASDYHTSGHKNPIRHKTQNEIHDPIHHSGNHPQSTLAKQKQSFPEHGHDPSHLHGNKMEIHDPIRHSGNHPQSALAELKRRDKHINHAIPIDRDHILHSIIAQAGHGDHRGRSDGARAQANHEHLDRQVNGMVGQHRHANDITHNQMLGDVRADHYSVPVQDHGLSTHIMSDLHSGTTSSRRQTLDQHNDHVASSQGQDLSPKDHVKNSQRHTSSPPKSYRPTPPTNDHWTKAMEKTTIDDFVQRLTTRMDKQVNKTRIDGRDTRIKVLPLSKDTIIQVLHAIAYGNKPPSNDRTSKIDQSLAKRTDQEKYAVDTNSIIRKKPLEDTKLSANSLPSTLSDKNKTLMRNLGNKEHIMHNEGSHSAKEIENIKSSRLAGNRKLKIPAQRTQNKSNRHILDLSDVAATKTPYVYQNKMHGIASQADQEADYNVLKKNRKSNNEVLSRPSLQQKQTIGSSTKSEGRQKGGHEKNIPGRTLEKGITSLWQKPQNGNTPKQSFIPRKQTAERRHESNNKPQDFQAAKRHSKAARSDSGPRQRLRSHSEFSSRNEGRQEMQQNGHQSKTSNQRQNTRLNGYDNGRGLPSRSYRLRNGQSNLKGFRAAPFSPSQSFMFRNSRLPGDGPRISPSHGSERNLPRNGHRLLPEHPPERSTPNNRQSSVHDQRVPNIDRPRPFNRRGETGITEYRDDQGRPPMYRQSRPQNTRSSASINRNDRRQYMPNFRERDLIPDRSNNRQSSGISNRHRPETIPSRGFDKIQRINTRKFQRRDNRPGVPGSNNPAGPGNHDGANHVISDSELGRGRNALRTMRRIITQSEQRSAAQGDPRRRIVVLPLNRKTVSRIFGEIGPRRQQ